MSAFGNCNRGLIRTAGRLMAAVVMVLMLSACPPLPGPGRAYACGDATSNHCYGIVEFNVVDFGDPNFQLFGTTVNAVALLGGDGEINDEIWVMQRRGVTNCGTQPSICWVEVGLSAGACTIPSNQTHVFWADNRPFEGFFCHDMGPLQHADFGQPVDLTIMVNASDPLNYDVAVQVCAARFAPCQPRWLLGQSTANAMAPDSIDMGMELSGTTGALAPGTIFSRTVAAVPGGDAKFIQVDGTVRANAPITADWESRPSSGNGGSFRTFCCF